MTISIVPRTLYARLSLGLVALLASVGLLYTLLSFSASRHYMEEVSQRLNRDLARDLVQDRNLVEEGRLNESAVETLFHEYMTINPSIEIYLLDLDGSILSFSADPGKVKRRQVSLAPILDFLEGRSGYPILGDDPRSHDRRKAFSVTPVPSVAAPEGYLYVVLRGERYDSVDRLLEESYLVRLSAWAVAGSLAFGLVAGLALFHLLTRRLRRLSSLMDRFRRSGFGEYEPYAFPPRAPPAAASGEAPGARESVAPYERLAAAVAPRADRVSSSRSPGDRDEPSATPRARAGDEIDQLGDTFDQMAERIVAQIEALEEQDALRRALVAQVSHDLRTPLAALQGYLETLVLKDSEHDEDTVSREERSEHLRIALRQSNRLTRLVSELFELAKLDAREAPPVMEPFAVEDLMQDIAQKFGLRATKRRVTLPVLVDEGLGLARGDVALIERVMDNLLDNALTYTPAGGTVTVRIRRDPAGIRIAVEDTGPGIPESELSRVFDRFYRAPGARAGTDHAGLGLTIASRIVALHGGELEVTSEFSRGARFSFVLSGARAPAPAATGPIDPASADPSIAESTTA